MKDYPDPEKNGPVPVVFLGCHYILQIARVLLFGMEKGNLELPEGPCLILANHSSFFDPLILISAATQPFGFVAGDHLYRVPFIRWFLSTMMGSISSEKGGNHMKLIRSMSRKIHAGNKLCMFGEGNITYDGVTEPLSIVTGKLARTLRCPVVTVRIEGSFMLRPRWSTAFSRSHVRCTRMNVYSPEQLREMTPQKITDSLNRDLYVAEPASADSTEKAFLCKAKGLQLVLYACPVCRRLQTIRPGFREITCTNCGATGRWTRYGTIESRDFPYHTLYEWHRWERSFVCRMAAEEPDFRVSWPDVLLKHLRGNKEQVVEAEGELAISRDGLDVGSRHFAVRDIALLDTRDKGILLFSTDEGEYYEIKGPGRELYPGLLYKEIFTELKAEEHVRR